MGGLKIRDEGLCASDRHNPIDVVEFRLKERGGLVFDFRLWRPEAAQSVATLPPLAVGKHRERIMSSPYRPSAPDPLKHAGRIEESTVKIEQ